MTDTDKAFFHQPNTKVDDGILVDIKVHGAIPNEIEVDVEISVNINSEQPWRTAPVSSIGEADAHPDGFLAGIKPVMQSEDFLSVANSVRIAGAHSKMSHKSRLRKIRQLKRRIYVSSGAKKYLFEKMLGRLVAGAWAFRGAIKSFPDETMKSLRSHVINNDVKHMYPDDFKVFSKLSIGDLKENQS